MLSGHVGELQLIKQVSSDRRMNNFSAYAETALKFIDELTEGVPQQVQSPPGPPAMAQDKQWHDVGTPAQEAANSREGHSLGSAADGGKTSSDAASPIDERTPSESLCKTHDIAHGQLKQNSGSEAQGLIKILAQHVKNEVDLEDWHHVRCIITWLVSEKCQNRDLIRMWASWLQRELIALGVVKVPDDIYQLVERLESAKKCDCPTYQLCMKRAGKYVNILITEVWEFYHEVQDAMLKDWSGHAR
jgi:hypothetical protein